MEYEFSLWMACLLAAVGVFSGCVNIMAAGGSLLTLPALLLLGMPADVANGTNRLGILMQSVAGVRGFHAQGRLDSRGILPALLPTGLGALAGAALASYLPLWLLEPVLLSCLMVIGVLLLVRPAMVIPESGSTPLTLRSEPLTLRARPWAALGLFLTGVYGGFVQAGVGFMLIAALAGGLRYDLVGANALKTVCTAVFAAVALLIFALRGQVWWLPGLALALGSMVGASLGVSFAVSVSQKTLKWLLFVMVMASCLAALLT